MLKSCLMAVFICCGSYLFSGDDVIDIGDWNESLVEDKNAVAEGLEAQILDQVQQGLAHIVAGNPWGASAQFENAATVLAKFDPGNPSYTFIISCGQAIAFDCLGLRQQCAEACARVSSFLLADEEETEDDDYTLTSEEQEESEKFFEVFTKAARLSPSVEVRNFLFLIISFFEVE